mmetsp:Transcript_28491/g.53436  ORF Transcript_28491/g.53436 Transcript_28491/m.53436 type:complete len:250 (-) Transcript_28491:707-1456(-)
MWGAFPGAKTHRTHSACILQHIQCRVVRWCLRRSLLSPPNHLPCSGRKPFGPAVSGCHRFCSILRVCSFSKLDLQRQAFSSSRMCYLDMEYLFHGPKTHTPDSVRTNRSKKNQGICDQSFHKHPILPPSVHLCPGKLPNNPTLPVRNHATTLHGDKRSSMLLRHFSSTNIFSAWLHPPPKSGGVRAPRIGNQYCSCKVRNTLHPILRHPCHKRIPMKPALHSSLRMLICTYSSNKHLRTLVLLCIPLAD